jgi:hypothetical protein
MANYAVTDWYVEEPNIADALAAMETYIETVDDTKTILLIGLNRAGETWTGYVIHEA